MQFIRYIWSYLLKSSHNNDVGIHVENHSGPFLVLGQLMDDIGRHRILIRMATSPYHEKSGPGESPVHNVYIEQLDSSVYKMEPYMILSYLL